MRGPGPLAGIHQWLPICCLCCFKQLDFLLYENGVPGEAGEVGEVGEDEVDQGQGKGRKQAGQVAGSACG
jgi:hypothetical protein